MASEPYVELERRIARIEDREAIRQLKWRYLRACDRKQPEAVRACFVPDAVIDYEDFPLFTSRDAFVALYQQFGCVPHIVDTHHGQNDIVEVDGDTARGWFDLHFFQIDTLNHRQTQLAVWYEDEFVRTPEGWRITRSLSRKLSTLVREGDADGRDRVVVAGRSASAGAAPAAR
ncbi:hypothetical protein GCM10027082_31860 [Comamonas humi]